MQHECLNLNVDSAPRHQAVQTFSTAVPPHGRPMDHLITYLRPSSSSSSGLFEPPIANLKVRSPLSELVDDGLIVGMQHEIEKVVGSRLAVAKATLLSILPLFIPSRRHKAITLDLARRYIEVVACISKLIKQTEETPQLIENVSQLEE